MLGQPPGRPGGSSRSRPVLRGGHRRHQVHVPTEPTPPSRTAAERPRDRGRRRAARTGAAPGRSPSSGRLADGRGPPPRQPPETRCTSTRSVPSTPSSTSSAPAPLSRSSASTRSPRRPWPTASAPCARRRRPAARSRPCGRRPPRGRADLRPRHRPGAQHVRGRVDYDNIGAGAWRLFSTRSPKFANGAPTANGYAPTPKICLLGETNFTASASTGSFRS